MGLSFVVLLTEPGECVNLPKFGCGQYVPQAHTKINCFPYGFFETKSDLKSHANFPLGKVGFSVWPTVTPC